MGFSLVSESVGYSLVAVCGLLIAVASLVVEHRLSCSSTCEDLPRPGIEPLFPMLAGRFFVTDPPGKSVVNI